MSDLATYQWEFSRKLAALTDEVMAWKKETKSAPNFNRHHSQVEAFADMLEVIRGDIEPTPEQPLKDGADASDRAKVLLGLFRIWEFSTAAIHPSR
jgi:hypothetical protein